MSRRLYITGILPDKLCGLCVWNITTDHRISPMPKNLDFIIIIITGEPLYRNLFKKEKRGRYMTYGIMYSLVKLTSELYGT